LTWQGKIAYLEVMLKSTKTTTTTERQKVNIQQEPDLAIVATIKTFIRESQGLAVWAQNGPRAKVYRS
jgi:hypothetical protein